MTSKQSLGIVLGILFVCSTVRADTGMNWASTTPLNSGNATVDIVDQFGTAIPTSSSWAAEIVTLGGTVLYTATGDGQWGNANAGQFFDPITASDSWVGDQVHTILFNNANPAAATMEAICGATTLNWVTSPEAPGVDYNIGTVGAGQWQAVPEPATLALFGIGMATLAARRRMKK